MILVTGGTGLIGSHLLLYLTRKGEKVRAIYRKKESLEKTKNLFKYYSAEPEILFNQIEWVQADITEITSLENVFEGITQVYHTAALVSFDKKDKDLLHLTNVEGTANLLHLAQSTQVEKFLYVSSIAALGQYDQPVTEKTHWNWKEKHSDYAVSKYLSEMEVWRAGQEGLPVVIINPSVVLGAHFLDSGFGTIISKLEKGLKYFPPGGNGIVDVWDVVKIMTSLMQSAIKNDSFIVSSYNKSYKDLLDAMAKELAVKSPKKALPKSLAYLLFLMGKLPKSMMRTFYQFPHYTSGKLEKAINYNPIPFEASVQNLVSQYKKSQ